MGENTPCSCTQFRERLTRLEAKFEAHKEATAAALASNKYVIGLVVAAATLAIGILEVIRK